MKSNGFLLLLVVTAGGFAQPLKPVVLVNPAAAGSIQPKQFNLVPILFSLLLSMLMPLVTLVALLPLGLEWGVDRLLPGISAIPFSFLLSIVWVAASLWLYRWILPWEGQLFAKREKELLRIVTSKIE